MIRLFPVSFICLFLFFPPLFGDEKKELPTAKEILQKAVQKAGGDKFKDLKSLSFRQTMEIDSPAGAIKGEGTLYFLVPNQLVIRARIMGVEVEEGFDGKRGWKRQFGRVQEIPKENLFHLKRVLQGLSDWLIYPYLKGALTLKGKTKVNQEEVYEIEVSQKNKKALLYFHSKTYELVRKVEVLPGANPTKLGVDYRDPINLQGFIFHRRHLLYRNDKKIGAAENSEFKINEDLGDKIFKNPLPSEEAAKKKAADDAAKKKAADDAAKKKAADEAAKKKAADEAAKKKAADDAAKKKAEEKKEPK